MNRPIRGALRACVFIRAGEPLFVFCSSRRSVRGGAGGGEERAGKELLLGILIKSTNVERIARSGEDWTAGIFEFRALRPRAARSIFNGRHYIDPGACARHLARDATFHEALSVII